MHLSVGMGEEVAGMWYLSKHVISSANISLSIHKNLKNHKNCTRSKIKFHIIFIFFSIMDIKFFTTGGFGGGLLWEEGNVILTE